MMMDMRKQGRGELGRRDIYLRSTLSTIEQILFIVCFLIDLAGVVFQWILQASAPSCSADENPTPCREQRHEEIDCKGIDIVWILGQDEVS
jgi:hypothetical protein